MVIDPVTLVVRCTGCVSEATIKFEEADSAEEAVWQCPRCQTRHPLGVVGRIAWTVKQPLGDHRHRVPGGGGRSGLTS